MGGQKSTPRLCRRTAVPPRPSCSAPPPLPARPPRGSHAAAQPARAPPWRGPAAPALRPVRGPTAPPPRGDPGGSSPAATGSRRHPSLPSALRPRRAPGFPVHRPNPLLLGATRRQNLPRTSCQLCPTPRLFPSQTKEPRENLPELQRKSLIQSFLGLTFNFKNNKSRNQKSPRLEVGVRGNARGRRFIPSAAFTQPPPFFWPLPRALMLSSAPPTLVYTLGSTPRMIYRYSALCMAV